MALPVGKDLFLWLGMAASLSVALFCRADGKADQGAKDLTSKIDQKVEGLDIRIRSFLPDTPINRTRRATVVTAVVENRGEEEVQIQATLALPKGIHVVGLGETLEARIDSADSSGLSWTVRASTPGPVELSLQVKAGGAVVAQSSLTVDFLRSVRARKLKTVPQPDPVKTRLLIGAHHCPLWEADKPHMWDNVLKHPERTPALGFYAQENPEVSDWETKWAVEHGVSFFIYCWYRASQGEPVQTRFSSAIHEALFKSRFVNAMKFTIMWENQSRGQAGVADEKDLKENLFPFWMENYFRHPSYLKVDHKPVLFIYRPEFLIEDLGGVENVAKAMEWMREECRKEGFGGLTILGEYRGLDPKHLALMKSLGLDYTFAYCWYVGNSPTPDQAIQAQMQSIQKTQELGVLPQVVTVSQAWSGWADEGSLWKIPPHEYEGLLQKASDFIRQIPPDQLGSRMLLLDNWNEWGEGHYIAPYREFGFGYLDAVRKVFSNAPSSHVDLIPEDIGLGPYDTAYKALAQKEEDLRRLGSRRVCKEGAPEPGLIAWWAFDEEGEDLVTLDYSGHRLGGQFQGDVERTQGIDGRGLNCHGGCVLVPSHPLLSPAAGLTIACWIKTDLAGQDNKWIVNRVLGGGTSTGYRLGVLDGKPCFEVPLTDWSHHLTGALPLPTGRWVHLAGTFDGTLMRLYVDGGEQGAMERPGEIKGNAFPLRLGNYETDHPAFFTGLLDEVQLYDRALSQEEIQGLCTLRP